MYTVTIRCEPRERWPDVRPLVFVRSNATGERLPGRSPVHNSTRLAQLTVDRSRTAFLNMLTFGPSHELCASDSSCVASCESAVWRSRTDARSAAESD